MRFAKLTLLALAGLILMSQPVQTLHAATQSKTIAKPQVAPHPYPYCPATEPCCLEEFPYCD